jgi:plastocyanin
MKISLGIWLFIFLIAAGLVYAGTTFFQKASSAPSAPLAGTNTVILSDTGFSPQTLTIKPGDNVTWVNQSQSDATVNSDPHPTHTDYPPLNLGSFLPGASLSLIFNSPGTYKYHNHLNPSQTGTVVVK